ncbi:hypothetical protein CEUSTIGMA_g9015.t1 [Chlamydomonas eustigma]|uniref:Uncharacterized protein n=1 Tax=Chlamydomonas eustigma TaxID=1157962 RepID=A0A250XEU1_9CHLO|nr:hypothetical protein CEUSTIGMA_g9015.t1 [Chlamydomonas eustigma]|eukprot:GAX81587.1 hypothetical protein CEUSTIGMA_g9015.t1 [Chlamydomonas eustigma]
MSAKVVPLEGTTPLDKTKSYYAMVQCLKTYESKKAEEENVYWVRLDAWTQVFLTKLEVFKRKSPRLFKIAAFVVVIADEFLYVYDLYTDVVLLQVSIIA